VYGVDFQAPYGPARYYLIAFHFILFGQSLHALNGLFLAVMALNCALIYRVARYLVPRPPALFAAFLAATAHGSMHKGFYILSGLLVLHALFGFIRSGGSRGAFRLGFTVIVVLLLRWDVGVTGLAAAVAAFLLMWRFKQFEPGVALPGLAARITSGFMLPGFPAGLFFFFVMNPWDFITHTAHRIKAFQWYREEYRSWFELFTSPESKARIFSILFLVFFMSLAACLAIGITGLLKRRDGRRALLLIALALVGFSLLNQVHVILRFNRFLQAAPPFFIASAVMLHTLGHHLKSSAVPWARLAGRIGMPALGAGLALLLMLYLYWFTGLASQDSFAVLRYKERFVAIPRARCYMKEGMARDLEDTLSLIEKGTRPTDRIFAGPACPLLYFLADKTNPTPYLDWLYYYFNPDAEHRIIKDIDSGNVVLFVDLKRSPATCAFEEACPDLSIYLRKNFRPLAGAKRATRFVLRERR
jgi:hypothetical protein